MNDRTSSCIRDHTYDVWKLKALKQEGDFEGMVDHSRFLLPGHDVDNVELRSLYIDAGVCWMKARLSEIYSITAAPGMKAEMAKEVGDKCAVYVALINSHSRKQAKHPAEHYESDERDLYFWQNKAFDLATFYSNRSQAFDYLDGAIPVPFSEETHSENRFNLQKYQFYPIGDGNQVVDRLLKQEVELKWELNAAMLQFPEDTSYALSHAVAILGCMEKVKKCQVQAFRQIYAGMEMWPGDRREPKIFRIKKEQIVSIVSELLLSYRDLNGSLREVSSQMDDGHELRFQMAYAITREDVIAEIRKSWRKISHYRGRPALHNCEWEVPVQAILAQGFAAGTLPFEPVFFVEEDEEDIVDKATLPNKVLTIFKRSIPGIWHERGDHLYCIQYDDGSLVEHCDDEDLSGIHLRQPVTIDF